jgi:hypothetical protein
MNLALGIMSLAVVLALLAILGGLFAIVGAIKQLTAVVERVDIDRQSRELAERAGRPYIPQPRNVS